MKRTALALLLLALVGCTAPTDGRGAGPTAQEPAPTQPDRQRTVVFTDTGTGAGTTERFTVTEDAEVRYSYDCAPAEGGIFQVFVEGGSALVLANSTAVKDADSSFLNEPGTYYLTVNTTCPWRLDVLS